MSYATSADNNGELQYRTTAVGQYDLVPWSGRNDSGIQPLCDKVLVMPDQASGMVGNVIIPDTVLEHIGAAAMTGVLVAVGDQAFAYDSRRLVRWEGKRPEPGVRVWFQKYAGEEYTGKDGLLYRVMEDRSLAGFEIPGAEEAA